MNTISLGQQNQVCNILIFLLKIQATEIHSSDIHLLVELQEFLVKWHILIFLKTTTFGDHNELFAPNLNFVQTNVVIALTNPNAYSS